MKITKFYFIIILHLLLVAMCACIQTAKAEDLKALKNIYVEATGNNKYEAKIKANRRGMYRTLTLIADKMKIPTPDFAHVPYDVLERIFEVKNERDEKYEAGWYSATVDMAYEQHEINDLILKYTRSNVTDILYEYVLIPVFKQQDKILLNGKDNLWINKWRDLATSLHNNMLFYPTNLIDDGRVNSTNVLHLSYENYLSMFPEKLFKNVFIVVAEQFTKENGDAYLEVEYRILMHGEEKFDYKEYPINYEFSPDKQYTQAINEILSKYGIKASRDYQARTKQRLDKAVTYHLFFEVYDEDSLERVKSKLDGLEGQYSITIKKGEDHEYMIDIKTTDSLEELAYQIYSKGLTFVKSGNRYHLIEATTGI